MLISKCWAAATSTLKEPTADALAAAKHVIKAFERIPEAKRGMASKGVPGNGQSAALKSARPDAAYYGATVRPRTRARCSSAGSSTTAGTRSSSVTYVPKQ